MEEHALLKGPSLFSRSAPALLTLPTSDWGRFFVMKLPLSNFEFISNYRKFTGSPGETWVEPFYFYFFGLLSLDDAVCYSA